LTSFLIKSAITRFGALAFWLLWKQIRNWHATNSIGVCVGRWLITAGMKLNMSTAQRLAVLVVSIGVDLLYTTIVDKVVWA
jgi:hypothetical protein